VRVPQFVTAHLLRELERARAYVTRIREVLRVRQQVLVHVALLVEVTPTDGTLVPGRWILCAVELIDVVL